VTCTQVRNSLGVYVVGAIDPAERAGIERHVAECTGCRDEVAGLAGLPALLGRVTEDQIDEVAGVGGDTFERVLTEVVAERKATGRRQRRRNWSFAAVVLPVAAAMVIGVVVVLPQFAEKPKRNPKPPVQTHEEARPVTTLPAYDPTTGVSATIGLSKRAWGTALTAQVRGVPLGTTCTLEAVSQTGKRNPAASWRVTHPPSVFAGSTMMLPEEISRIEVRSTDGKRTYVSVRVH
jgi:predicted anti-sigma-YlaC factor YlaD